jgi:YidC/Oxa1 family membrane protein insertase
MGLSMFIQQKLGPASPDPTQAKMMMLLPVLFTFLFSSFPSGLVLYWTVNNTLSILQQWYITRKYSGENTTKNSNGMSSKKLATSK